MKLVNFIRSFHLVMLNSNEKELNEAHKATAARLYFWRENILRAGRRRHQCGGTLFQLIVAKCGAV